MNSYLDEFIITEDTWFVIWSDNMNSFLCNNTRCPDLLNENMRNLYKYGFEVAHFSELNRLFYSVYGFKEVITYPDLETAKQALVHLLPKLEKYFPEYKNWKIRRIRTKLFLEDIR